MTELPERESDIIALALRMAQWLDEHPDLAAGAPHSAAQLRAAVATFYAADATARDAEARSRETHADYDRSLVELKETLKANLWRVDVDVRGRPEPLSGLGWGGRPGATDREPPGKARDLAAQRQGDASVVLSWRPPVDGGPAAEYRVQRRTPGRTWEFVALAANNDCFLSGQPRGIEFDLRVVAVNKAGSGPPSATITVVL